MAELYSNPLIKDANLVSYFRLEGDATDYKNTNNGTATDITFSTANGIFGQCGGFDGDSSKIMCNDSASLDIVGAYSYSLWLKPTALPASEGFANLLCKYDTGAPGGAGGYELRLQNPAGTPSIYAGNYGGASVVANYTLSTTAWTHLVLTWDATNFVVYINGSVISSTKTGTGNASANSKKLNIGTFGAIAGTAEVGRWYNGLMDDIAIFNRALTAAEVKLIYITGAGTLMNML